MIFGRHIWTIPRPGTRHEPKFPCLGYAPPEYQTKPWPFEAPIKGWFPPYCKEQNLFEDDEYVPTSSQQCSGEQNCFEDNREAILSTLQRNAPMDLESVMPCRRLSSTQRLAPIDVAPSTQADAVRSKTKNVWLRDKFVLDTTFDKSNLTDTSLRTLLDSGAWCRKFTSLCNSCLLTQKTSVYLSSRFLSGSNASLFFHITRTVAAILRAKVSLARGGLVP